MASTSNRLTDADYDALTREVFASVEETVDRLLQDDVIDIDANRTGGLLEMRFPNGGTIVVNTQPPLQEIWLAAPSGGYHFQASGSQWIDSRDGREFFDALSACASELAGKAIRFET